VEGISVRDTSGGPLAALAYAVLSLTDMMFSSVAFVLGVPEANPVLGFLCRHGLFMPAKVLLTVVVVWLILWLYPRGQGRSAAWFGVAAMGGAVAYHVWGLQTL